MPIRYIGKWCREVVAEMKQQLYALARKYRDTDVVTLLETLMQNEKGSPVKVATQDVKKQ